MPCNTIFFFVDLVISHQTLQMPPPTAVPNLKGWPCVDWWADAASREPPNKSKSPGLHAPLSLFLSDKGPSITVTKDQVNLHLSQHETKRKQKLAKAKGTTANRIERGKNKNKNQVPVRSTISSRHPKNSTTHEISLPPTPCPPCDDSNSLILPAQTQHLKYHTYNTCHPP